MGALGKIRSWHEQQHLENLITGPLSWTSSENTLGPWLNLQLDGHLDNVPFSNAENPPSLCIPTPAHQINYWIIFGRWGDADLSGNMGANLSLPWTDTAQSRSFWKKKKKEERKEKKSSFRKLLFCTQVWLKKKKKSECCPLYLFTCCSPA